ncbi:hypothetical protein SORBI_3003G099800, partial [Sorghum bicolor]
RANELWKLLTSEDLAFNDAIICRFANDSTKAGDVRSSFALREGAIDSWVDYFIQCIMHDEPARVQRSPQRKRLYLNTTVLKYIFQEGNVPDGQKVTYNARDLLDVLSPILPHKQELKDLQEIVLPVIRKGHFSVYIVNFVLIHILDPNPWDEIGKTGWKDTHFGKINFSDGEMQFCKRLMLRLNDAIQFLRPNVVRRFRSYMCEMLHAIPKQAVCSEDCAFYCMLYMDNYDAATGTVHWPYTVNNVPINVSSQAIRADILHYIVYHDANEQKELPPEVQRLRHTER